MRYLGILIVIAIIGIGIYFITQSTKPLTQQHSTSSQTSQNITSTPAQISVGKVPTIPFSLPSGYTIHVFASGLSKPRDLQMSPNGTLLVSDMGTNTVYALPDENHDGVADSEKEVLSDSDQPHGLAFYNGNLYVARIHGVDGYSFDETNLTVSNRKQLFSLPNNTLHNHRTLVFSNSGTLYVNLGSTCNACIESAITGGSVLISDADGTTPKLFSTGLRNATFLAINPRTNDLWATENGRDDLGNTIPPDEIDILEQGQNYGWPNCYGNKIPVAQQFQTQCSTTATPIHEIDAHSAPLGLTFINSSQFPSNWQGDLLVAYHGSEYRSNIVGYKIVHMKVNGNTITGENDFLTGFNIGTTANDALGRPVDMTFDSAGDLYISDDKAGDIYIVQKEK